MKFKVSFPEPPTDSTMCGVSIITRTQDRPLLLERACRSVLNQSFHEWMHIIVNDGGSVESVANIVKKFQDEYRSRLVVLHNKQVLGMEAASNIGIHNSSSRYVVLLDDDDSWHPDFLQTCVDFMENSKFGKLFAGVVTHSAIIRERIEGTQVIQVEEIDFNSDLKSVGFAALCTYNRFPNNSFLFRKSIWEELGGFNETLPVLGDWEFNLRVLSRWEVGVIPKKLTYFHHRLTHQGSSYGNTVIAGIDQHVLYDQMIRNQILRSEFASGAAHLGLMASLGREIEESKNRIIELERALFRTMYRLDRIFGWIRLVTRPVQKVWSFVFKSNPSNSAL